MKQQDENGRRVVRWQGVEGGRLARWEGERFLVFFKRGGCRMNQRFYLFVSVSQEWVVRFKNSLDYLRDGKTPTTSF